ncbi:BRCT domain-containing protein [Mangrovicoccus ximenensis]|uniref:BRCT domain-containing protein n=1 Tax=Mangrovicoccus ximenensis TaxID=1911570 RepID=UPI001374FCF9|nr:BRCT domain-containing protein [Mangrovicoccus ximenensis]
MLSEKVIRIMRKKELSIEPGMTETQAWNAVYAHDKQNRKPRPSINICFTGFTASAASKMRELATTNGFGVNSSVVKATTHLCCGSNAGPKKVEAARSRGLKILSYEEFQYMIETGELL